MQGPDNVSSFLLCLAQSGMLRLFTQVKQKVKLGQRDVPLARALLRQNATIPISAVLSLWFFGHHLSKVYACMLFAFDLKKYSKTFKHANCLFSLNVDS